MPQPPAQELPRRDAHQEADLVHPHDPAAKSRLLRSATRGRVRQVSKRAGCVRGGRYAFKHAANTDYGYHRGERVNLHRQRPRQRPKHKERLAPAQVAQRSEHRREQQFGDIEDRGQRADNVRVGVDHLFEVDLEEKPRAGPSQSQYEAGADRYPQRRAYAGCTVLGRFLPCLGSALFFGRYGTHILWRIA